MITILLLALVSFYFLCVDILADEAVLSLLGESTVMPIHIIYLPVMAAGVLFFSLVHKFTHRKQRRRISLCIIYAISASSLFEFIFISIQWLFICCIMICLFTVGVIGASVCFYGAIDLKGSGCTGKICGLGIGGAAILQILLLSASLPIWINALVLTAALCIAGYLILTKAPRAISDYDATYKVNDNKKGIRRSVIFLLLIVAVISLMGGINDGVLSLMNARGDIALYSFTRTFYLIGAITAGFIADYKRRRYLPISILVIMLFAAVGIMFLDSTVTLNINACIYSLFAGFAIIYFTVPFFDLAATSGNPALMAGMGRAIRLVLLALGTLLMELLLKSMDFSVTIGVFIFLSAILVLLFWIAGLLISPKELRVTDYDLTDFCHEFVFTRSETEIFNMVYNGYSTAEIAKALFLSEKTVRNHIAIC